MGALSMAQSLVQCYMHYVFSTRDRYPWFQNSEHREHTHAYLVGVCEKNNSPAIRVGGTADHVHIACRLSSSVSISDLARELKRASSAWLKTLSPNFKGFHWQSGYGAFSVSPQHADKLVAYIANQEEHHRQLTFQEEFRRFCEKYGVAIDERYVWD